MDLLHTAYVPPGDGPHPTVLALHGWGASALDLLGLAPHLGRGRHLVLCPQGGIEVPLGGASGWGWFPLTGGGPPDAKAVVAAVQQLRAFVDAAQRAYPVDAQRTVVAGFSQGGVMGYALALADPKRFAGLAALSSWLPAEIAAQAAEGRQSLRTLVHHGANDPMIPVARGRESVERLRELAVPVEFREFEMGHEINGTSLADLVRWLADTLRS